MPILGFSFSKKDDVVASAEIFDRRVTIQQPADVPDSQGTGTVRTWTNIKPGNATFWAHMEPWKGKQWWEADEDFAHSYERIVLRYRKTLNINSTMRIVYKSRIYTIRWVGVPNEARRVIDILGDELQAKGSVA